MTNEQLRRWNIREGDGALYICKGLHDKGEKCKEEKWVRSEKFEAAQKRIDELEEVKKLLAEIHGGLPDDDAYTGVKMLAKHIDELEQIEAMRDEEIAYLQEKHGNALIRIDELEATLSASKQPVAAQPAGWKLVPEKPTELMLERMQDQTMTNKMDLWNAWQGALAAAPVPPSKT